MNCQHLMSCEDALKFRSDLRAVAGEGAKFSTVYPGKRIRIGVSEFFCVTATPFKCLGGLLYNLHTLLNIPALCYCMYRKLVNKRNF